MPHHEPPSTGPGPAVAVVIVVLAFCLMGFGALLWLVLT